MTYWFVKSGKPRQVTFNYDRFQHQETEQELNLLLTQLKTWLQDYQQSQSDFPHHSNCQAKCPHYQSLVAANTNVNPCLNYLQAIAEIPETPI